MKSMLTEREFWHMIEHLACRASRKERCPKQARKLKKGWLPSWRSFNTTAKLIHGSADSVFTMNTLRELMTLSINCFSSRFGLHFACNLVQPSGLLHAEPIVSNLTYRSTPLELKLVDITYDLIVAWLEQCHGVRGGFQ